METFLQHWGYLALILFGFIQACSIPISSEITFGFAGVLAYQGHLSLALVIVIGSLAELAGSSASYGVGRIGGRHTVEKLARYVLVTKSDLDRVERFFSGRGSWAVAVGRMLPVVRAFVGIVAGFIEVPVGQFELFNVIGTVVWVTALASIGYAFGSAWTSVSHYVSVGGYIIVALVVLAMAAVIVHRVHEFRKERAAGAVADRGDQPASPAPGPAGDDRPQTAGPAHSAAAGGGQAGGRRRGDSLRADSLRAAGGPPAHGDSAGPDRPPRPVSHRRSPPG
ncbi:MAG TPA: DedA family protein [Streptosporangiaceae bacterium]|nr:DedA family protein [Streptosporangiaceae bacterium]